ncbi:uncharacterized protein LOC144563208 [Carex rostrata]
MKAKSSKKPYDEDKIRLKKSKSAKRKCSYPSDSSDSGRKKPRKSKKSKKKSRKRPRQPSISPTSSSYSSDYSVSSCSTCEKQKAGTGKSKVRKGRVSTGSKYTGRER